MENSRPTRAEIDLSAIVHNYRLLQEKAGDDVTVLAVVKADAYGHGAVAVSRALADAGAPMFAVATLEEAMQKSLDELDGVFTYIAVTKDELGVAKDELAAKPLVLYESDDLVALASEEIAIRQLVDREIETYDPYESEVMVWQR